MGLDSLTRRNFLKILGAAALVGCKSSPLTTLVDAPSKLRIIYFPDRHTDKYAAKAITHLTRFLAENKADAIALEGLVGEIDEGYLGKIKAAYAHRSHSTEYCMRVMKKIYDLESDQNYTRHAYYALHLLEPTLPCCQVDSLMIRAPGLVYALEFYGKIPIFGMEDYELYERVSRLQSLYDELIVSNDCQNPKENPKEVQIIAEHYSLDDYARSKDELNKELKQFPGDAECKFGRFLYETIIDQRSVVAVENVIKRQSEGTVLLIMGRAHSEGIRKACEERGISLQLLQEVNTG